MVAPTKNTQLQLNFTSTNTEGLVRDFVYFKENELSRFLKTMEGVNFWLVQTLEEG